jgi:short-subunit dehydrogenase
MTEQVVVITGAASGIGFALAQLCVERRFHVVLVDRARDALDQAALSLSQDAKSDVLALTCDVTKLEEVEQLVKKTYSQFNRVDLLINNAGISGPMVPLWELNHEQFFQVMDVNCFGVWHCVRAFMPRMLKQAHRSHVVNMASIYGLCSTSLFGAYATSKSSVVALSESLYFDLKRLDKPVDVSVVCPSFVNTHFLADLTVENHTPMVQKMASLMDGASSPADIATHILRAVYEKQFYIFPHPEAKDIASQRLQGMMEQTTPMEHGLQKMMAWLAKTA